MFDPEDLQRVLVIPSVQVMDRFDFRSVLDFLLLRLRSASGSSWLSGLLEFQKVIFHIFLSDSYSIQSAIFGPFPQLLRF